MKKILLLFAAMMIATGIQADEALKREMRAAWVATVYNIDWPSQSSRNNPTAQMNELNAYLDNFKAQNVNAIFLQVHVPLVSLNCLCGVRPEYTVWVASQRLLYATNHG